MALQFNEIIVNGQATWTHVPLLGKEHYIQNTTHVLLEYALDNTLDHGAFLKPYDYTEAFHQDLYIRYAQPTDQNGLAIQHYHEIVTPVTFPNALLVPGVDPEYGEVTLTGNTPKAMAIFRNPIGSGKHSPLLAYSLTVDAPSGNEIGTVLFQMVKVDTLTGAATYTDVLTGISIMQIDHTPGIGSSVEVATGHALLPVAVGYVGSSKGGDTGQMSIPSADLGLEAMEGDVFAIVAKNTGTALSLKVRFSVNWSEYF